VETQSAPNALSRGWFIYVLYQSSNHIQCDSFLLARSCWVLSKGTEGILFAFLLEEHRRLIRNHIYHGTVIFAFLGPPNIQLGAQNAAASATKNRELGTSNPNTYSSLAAPLQSCQANMNNKLAGISTDSI